MIEPAPHPLLRQPQTVEHPQLIDRTSRYMNLASMRRIFETNSTVGGVHDEQAVNSYRDRVARLFDNPYFVSALDHTELLSTEKLRAQFRNDLSRTYPQLRDLAPTTFADLDRNLSQKEYRPTFPYIAENGEGYMANAYDYLNQCLTGFNGWRDFIYDEHGQERHDMIAHFGPQFVTAAERLARFFVAMHSDEERTQRAAA